MNIREVFEKSHIHKYFTYDTEYYCSFAIELNDDEITFAYLTENYDFSLKPTK